MTDHVPPDHGLRKRMLGVLLVLGALLASPSWAVLPPPPAASAPVVKLEYDANGNPTKVIQAPGVAGMGFSTASSYDRLNRRKDSTDAKSKTTLFEYNGREDLTKVTDPRTLLTEYRRDGLGNVSPLISPDTGTAVNTYDAAGNLKTRLDGRSVLATYSYDGLNRPTSVVYSKTGQSSQAIGWTYDEQGAGFSNGVGRLTSTTFPAGVIGYSYDANYLRTSTTYATGTSRHAYDPQGRLISVTQTAPTGGAGPFSLTVGYTYDAAGHITGISYPSGRQLSIVHTDGQPRSITLAKDASSAPQTLISQIQFDPFDGPRSWQWQMSAGLQTYERVRDTSGRLVRYRLGNTIRDLTYDAADRITAYTHYDATTETATSALDQLFGYDALGRLISITLLSGTSWSIDYDDNGNRTSVSLNGSTSTYTTATDSNRLLSVSNPVRSLEYDETGNTVLDTGTSTNYRAVYDLTNRLSQIGSSGSRVNASFVYDAFGQRLAKTAVPVYSCTPLPNGAGHSCSVATLAAGTLFVYDQQGQILGEYNALTGAALREYVWLGSTPVAMFIPGATASDPPLAYYIHTDHLDTPRVVVDQGNNLRWRWLAEPFGTTAPETNPQSLGAFTHNLRAPGQYADADTGLMYNYFRDYDSSTGRYTQSDPIGLAGGINTYAYVGGNPLSYVDPLGLWSTDAHDAIIDAFFSQVMSGVPSALIDSVKTGSANIDLYNQVPSTSFMHAMRAPGQSVEGAQRKYCEFVQKNLAVYNALKNSGIARQRTSAYRALGAAMHAVMDSTSPSHSGFQVWDPTGQPGASYSHHGNHSPEDRQHLTWDLLNETLQRMAAAMNGNACGCGF